MRNLMLALGLAATVAPALVLPAAPAEAQRRYRDDRRNDNDRGYKYREWRDDRGRVRCRKPDGTTGLVVGGVAGALLGRTIDTRGDRTIGTLGGHVAGDLVTAFRRRHPAVAVRFHETDFTDPTAGLRTGLADVALTRQPFDRTGISVRELRPDPVGADPIGADPTEPDADAVAGA